MKKKSKSPNEIMPASPMMDRKWRAEEDIRTLQRAAEIKADKSRLSMAKKTAAEQAAQLKKIC